MEDFKMLMNLIDACILFYIVQTISGLIVFIRDIMKIQTKLKLALFPNFSRGIPPTL